METQQVLPNGMLVLQIRLFVPELNHPAYGVVRAIVKDGNDLTTGAGVNSFLDSDGEVGHIRGPNDTVSALRNLYLRPCQSIARCSQSTTVVAVLAHVASFLMTPAT